jgi:hypothetical protein
MLRWRRKKALAAVPDDELGLLEQIASHGDGISFGAPTRCPACGDFGFVEAVAGGVQRNKCLHCGEIWQFSHRGVDLFNFASSVRSEEQKVIGRGALINTQSIGHYSRMTRERFVSMRDVLRNTFSGDDR